MGKHEGGQGDQRKWSNGQGFQQPHFELVIQLHNLEPIGRVEIVFIAFINNSDVAGGIVRVSINNG
jgi:hypothetical protein